MFSKGKSIALVLFILFSLIIMTNTSCVQSENQNTETESSEEAAETENIKSKIAEEKAVETEGGEIEEEIEEVEGEIKSPDETGSEAEKEEEGKPEVTEDKGEPMNPVVLINTSMGNIKVELFQKEAPITVKNFLDYVNEDFYNGTIFHRVISGFMIQGGGFIPDMTQKPTKEPIKNEATNKISNSAGTIAMARTQIVDSATSQFYINLVDNLQLDHKNETMRGYGYCVFGKVIEGMDVVEKIGGVPTTSKGHYRDVPVTPVLIKSIRLMD